MTAGPFRAVVFDAVGTLIHAEPSVSRVYADVGRRHGGRHDSATIEERFRVAFRRQEAIDRQRNWITSEEREVERWRAIVADVFPLVDAAKCFSDLYEHFARPAAWRVELAAMELIQSLRRREISVALASNFDARLHGIVAGLPELRNLNAVIVSSEVGFRKPRLAFFEAIEARLGIPMANIIFVGDDPINDGKGAADAGMKSLLLGRDIKEFADVETFLETCRPTSV